MVRGKMLAVVLVLVGLLAVGAVGCEVEEDLGAEEVSTHYDGARIGLVVPDYVEVNSIEELNDYADDFNEEIVGIDPGAGVMSTTEDAIMEYDLELDLAEGSDAAMTAELDDAIANEEPIVVTGWTPHWKFAEWDLKFLEDPQDVYGDAERIANVARLGLAEDLPEVYEFLENFYWGDEEIGEVMEINAEDDSDLLGNAQAWVADNQDLVEGWLPEGFGEEAEGQELSIAYVEWDCATASTHVAQAVLEDAGYDVSISAVDAGPMWSAVAEGDVDFISCAWLPVTHESYWQEYGVE